MMATAKSLLAAAALCLMAGAAAGQTAPATTPAPAVPSQGQGAGQGSSGQGAGGQTPGGAGGATQGNGAQGTAPAGNGSTAADMQDMKMAVLQGLDKITARVSTFDVPVGGTVPFGSLKITVRACRKAPPIDPPESAAFMEITDAKPDEPARTVFSGWMFASSPALSALENPVYDVWVLSCTNEANAPGSTTP